MSVNEHDYGDDDDDDDDDGGVNVRLSRRWRLEASRASATGHDKSAVESTTRRSYWPQ